MKSIFPILAAGAGALLLAGSVALAASRPAVHDITVELPGGGMEHIQYTGNVAPRIVFGAPASLDWTMPAAWWPSFPAFDALDAAMDRQMNAMLQQARALETVTASGGVNDAALRNLPPGTTSYTWISTSDGTHSCTRAIRVSASEDGVKPQVVSQTSGDCGDGAAPRATKPIEAKWNAASARDLSARL